MAVSFLSTFTCFNVYTIKTRFKRWPNVFHSKNFLQTNLVNKGHAAKIASETNPSELTYAMVFGFAQMHGEEDVRSFAMDQSDLIGEDSHNRHAIPNGHRCLNQDLMPVADATSSQQKSTPQRKQKSSMSR